jgi:hypothetical protein
VGVDGSPRPSPSSAGAGGRARGLKVSTTSVVTTASRPPADFAPRTHRGSSTPTLARGIGGIVAIEEVMPPDKCSQAAGQVFEPDRPHKSLHVLRRRP